VSRIPKRLVALGLATAAAGTVLLAAPAAEAWPCIHIHVAQTGTDVHYCRDS
jgi:hypothetical protein